MGVKAEMLGKPAAYGPVMEELVHSLESRQYELVEQTQRFTLRNWRVNGGSTYVGRYESPITCLIPASSASSCHGLTIQAVAPCSKPS